MGYGGSGRFLTEFDLWETIRAEKADKIIANKGETLGNLTTP